MLWYAPHYFSNCNEVIFETSGIPDLFSKQGKANQGTFSIASG